MRIHIVRHGQTEWNLDGLAQGHTDIPLDSVGLDQAERVGRAFIGLGVERIFTSDLQRAFVTAEQIALNTYLEMEVRQDLRERCFGDWEGLKFKEFYHRITGDPAYFRPPGGESFHDVWKRLDTFKAVLLSDSRDTAVITHGGTGGVLAAKLIQGNVESSYAFRFGNTAITTLERRPDGHFAIQRYNNTDHLR